MKKKFLILMTGVIFTITQCFATGTPTVYTDEAAYLAALGSNYYLEDFSSYSDWTALDNITFSSGDFSYKIPILKYSSAYIINNQVSYSYCNPLRINNINGGVNAFGGYFYSIDDSYSFISGNSMTITVGSYTYTYTPTSQSQFVGFIFPDTISDYIDITYDESGTYGYASMDHFYVGKTATSNTITTTAGSQTYDVSALGLSDADIVELSSGTDSTDAVVVDGKIDFYTPTAGDYAVTKKGTVSSFTKSYVDATTNTSEGTQGSYGGVLDFGQYKGVGDDIGTANRPLTALTHFIGIDSTQVGNVSSSWKQANTYVGYNWFGTAPSTRGACYLLMEDRNETTGKLLASLYFDPSISEVGSQEVMGPHGYNFIFNPTNAIISAALATHSVYSGSSTRQAEALDSVVAVRDADTSMVLANIEFMRAFSTKAKTYTFDIATISNGKFQAGDILELKYLLGSNDHSVYHSTLSTASTAIAALEANAQSQIGIDTVDADGYVKFNIYGGGFLSLTRKIEATTGIESTSFSNSICASGKAITISSESGSKVEIFSLSGMTILSDKMTTDKVSYTISNAGIYIVKVSNQSGVVTQKIVIQ